MTWQPFLFQPNLFKSILHRNHKVQEIVLLFAGSNQLSQASNSSLWSFYSIHATIAYNIILWQSIYELNISDWTAGLAWQSKCHLFCKIFANNAEWNIIALSIFSESWNEIILNLYRCQADHDLPAQISRALIFTHFQHFYHSAAELREPTSWRDSPCPRVNFTLLGQETKCLKLFLIDGSDDIAHDRVPW